MPIKLFAVSMEYIKWQMVVKRKKGKKKNIIMQLPVSMTIYYTRKNLSFSTANRNVMAALKNITPTVF